MRDVVVSVQHVWKEYIHYHHILTSLKEVVLHFPRLARRLRESRFLALKDVSFEVYRGEVFGIMGHNGAGKSTLLALIAGVMKPTAGSVKVCGRVAPLLELGTGFQYDLTGRENIFLNGILLGMTRRQIQKKLDEIIAFAELEAFIDEPVRIYSSGMLARLGFAIAIHTDPDILLIDEVLAVGDEAFQKKCLKKLDALRKQGVTMIFVSHNRQQMEQICDRILHLKNGQVQQIERIRQNHGAEPAGTTTTSWDEHAHHPTHNAH